MKKRYLTMMAGFCAAMLMLSAQAEEHPGPVTIKKEREEKTGQEVQTREWFDFQIEIDGESYSFPAEVSEWTARGWSDVTEEAVLLMPGKTKSNRVFQKGETRILVSVENQSENRESTGKASVTGVTADLAQSGEMKIQLPGGIVPGVSTQPEIEQMYGAPADRYEGEQYVQLTYRYGLQSYIRLDVDRETDLLSGFEIQNAVVREMTEEVPREATSADASLEEDMQLGTDLLSGRVSFDSDLYELPASLEEFLDHGFVFLAEESDTELAPMTGGFAVLQKENRSVTVRIENTSSESRTAQECEVTSLSESVYEEGFSLVLPGEIQIGMTQQELERALEGVQAEQQESEHFFYYGIRDSQSDLGETSIFVEKETGLVVKIQIER